MESLGIDGHQHFRGLEQCESSHGNYDHAMTRKLTVSGPSTQEVRRVLTMFALQIKTPLKDIV